MQWEEGLEQRERAGQGGLLRGSDPELGLRESELDKKRKGWKSVMGQGNSSCEGAEVDSCVLAPAAAGLCIFSLLMTHRAHRSKSTPILLSLQLTASSQDRWFYFLPSECPLTTISCPPVRLQVPAYEMLLLDRLCVCFQNLKKDHLRIPPCGAGPQQRSPAHLAWEFTSLPSK